MNQQKIGVLLSRLQGIGQTGLTYGKDVYDKERYQELIEVTSDLIGELTDLPKKPLHYYMENDAGYATPKVDIRALIFHEDKLLLVQEKLDGNWSLPGGWGDIGYSPFEVAAKEVQEEAGIAVQMEKLVAVKDMAKHDYPYGLNYVYKFFIYGKWLSGDLQGGVETAQAKFFSLAEIKALPLSLERNLVADFEMVFAFHQTPFATICD